MLTSTNLPRLAFQGSPYDTLKDQSVEKTPFRDSLCCVVSLHVLYSLYNCIISPGHISCHFSILRRTTPGILLYSGMVHSTGRNSGGFISTTSALPITGPAPVAVVELQSPQPGAEMRGRAPLKKVRPCSIPGRAPTVCFGGLGR